ncbi:MAG: phosphopantothenoylcysteine decarboxylase [Candidatus Omnitrophota bacterium]
MGLKNKKLLITAGPTWVKIDDVRVISNIASGETGILLANKAARSGAKVTLLLGPVPDKKYSLVKTIKLLPFKFFDELKEKIIKELKANKFDAVIHSAAVCDYKPKKTYKNKISSGLRFLTLNLVPTPKILDLIKNKNKALKVTGFKFETRADRNKLVNKAKALLKRSKSDLVVANTISNSKYIAYIISSDKLSGPISDKEKLASELLKKIGGLLE